MTADERDRARDVLDLQDGSGPVPVLDEDGALDLLAAARRIAVVGASPDPYRPSHSVMRYLQTQGYECVPVNPNARDVLGIPAFASLEEAVAASGPFDIVDVFRRSELTVPVAESAVATGCRALWLQLGIVDWQAARIAYEAGLAVVMDRCTAIDHRRLRGR
ncbi:MAG TPA: CoA-binding protein [Candidatus Limnocylindrales bacterium]|jgi:predicted CoA-binding protein